MFVLLIIVLVVVGLAVVALLRDGGIQTPIPMSVVTWGQNVTDGSFRLTVWRVSLLVVLFAFATILATSGIIGWIVAGIIFSIMLSDAIKQIFRDLWDANFWSVDP